MDLKSNKNSQTNRTENQIKKCTNYIVSNKSKENTNKISHYYKTEEDENNEEEEEINSDEYVSSSMLDVETNTYINLSLLNSTNKKIISGKEKEYKIKKIEKKCKNIVNIYSKKDNNQILKKEDKIHTIDQNNMVPINQFFQNNKNNINQTYKDINSKNNLDNNNDKTISYNNSLANNNIINIKKEKITDDNKINNYRINTNNLLKKNNSEIEKKNHKINLSKINKLYYSKNNNKKDNSKEEYSNCILNENILRDLLILKNGKNCGVLKNSGSIKLEKTQGRLSTSPKLESLYKNFNKSNINLDILRKLKKNYSNNIIDDTTINSNNKINPNSKIYIKKIHKYIITKDGDSPLKKLIINTSASLNNKKIDFLKNNKINEDIINYIQNKKLLNNKKSKSKSKSKGKEKNLKLKKENSKNLHSNRHLNILKYFKSFGPKKEKKMNKNMTNEQFLTCSNNNHNITHNNSGIANKSIDAKKIYELSKRYKLRVKQRRNLSTDIDYISNIIPEKLNRLSNKNELKEQFLSNIIKKKDYLTNRSQHGVISNNIKNNSKFSLRNNLLLNDNVINYIIISKANKNMDINNNKSKYDTKSLFDGYLSSNNKNNNESVIYKKIMKNFYNFGRSKNANSNVSYQHVCGKNNRRTEYKSNFRNNPNYSINNNISNNINNININTSNNLINVITNITTNNEYQSLSNKKSSIKHNLTNNLINNYLIQNQKFKREIGLQFINNIIRLSTVDSNNNKKICSDNSNNNYLKSKFLKNINHKNEIKKYKNLEIKNSVKHKKNSLSLQYNNILNNNKSLLNKLSKMPNTSESIRKSSNDKKDNKIHIRVINKIDKKGKNSNINSERNNYKTKFKIIKYKYIKEQNVNKKIKKG